MESSEQVLMSDGFDIDIDSAYESLSTLNSETQEMVVELDFKNQTTIFGILHQLESNQQINILLFLDEKYHKTLKQFLFP